MKDFLLKHWKIIAIIVLVVILIGGGRKYFDLQKRHDQNENAYKIREEGFKTMVNKQGQTIYTQKQIIVSKNSEYAQEIERSETLEKENGQLRFKLAIKLPPDTVKVPVDRIVKIKEDSLEFSFLKLPYSFGYGEKWFGYKFTFTEDGYVIRDSLTFYVEPVITFGYEKQRWWKDPFMKDVPALEYRDNNPYVRVLDMSNIKIENKKRKPEFRFFLGGGGVWNPFNGRIHGGIVGGYGITF